MIEEELIKIWQSSPNEEQVKFEKSRLMLDVQANVDRFNKGMKWLYLRETIGAVVMIPIFIIYAIVFKPIMTKVASLLIVCWALYILYMVYITKKKEPKQYSLNYLDYLHKNKSYLELQKRLREKVVYWYILPLLVMMFLFMFGLNMDEPNKLENAIKIIAFLIVFGTIIYYLNKVSAKKFVEPKLKKVNELIETLEE